MFTYRRSFVDRDLNSRRCLVGCQSTPASRQPGHTTREVVGFGTPGTLPVRSWASSAAPWLLLAAGCATPVRFDPKPTAAPAPAQEPATSVPAQGVPAAVASGRPAAVPSASDPAATGTTSRRGTATQGQEAAASDGLIQSGFFSLGVAALPEFEGSDELQGVPLIVSNVKFRNGMSLEVEGITSRLDLLADSFWRWGPIVNLTFGRNDDNVGSAALRALDDVDDALEVGAFVGVSMPLSPPILPDGFFTADVSVRHDVLDAHDGLLAAAEAEFAFPMTQRLFFVLEFATTYASDNYMDAFFGVSSAGAAASGLAAFAPEAGVKDFGPAAIVSYALGQNLGVFARLSYRRLIGDAADSPIVDVEGSPDQWFVGAGLSWRF
ncbi:MAG: MipA/OmpV family protein [Planctomycetota bacterium]